MAIPVTTDKYLKEQFDWHQKRTLGYFEKVLWNLGFCASWDFNIDNLMPYDFLSGQYLLYL